MRKILFFISLFLFSLLSVLAVIFYRQNLTGVGPAIKSPPKDIAKIIDENTTGMPLKMPDGFSVSIFAKDLKKPRVMAFDPVGNMLVSIPSEGKVVALSDDNNDGVSDRTTVVIEKLNRPNGLAFRCGEDCKLYIAESDKVVVYDYDEENLKAINGNKIVDLPDGGNHFTRTLMFMPYPNEDRLLIAVGSSCNVCDEKDDRRAKILSVNFDGSDLKEFARGLRNSVFMAIHPVTGKIWATEMGRDLLGDDLPPDEINIIEEGKDYGWPTCYGKNIHDADFDKNVYIMNPCQEPFETESYIDIPAHSAPLGLSFVPEEGWPEDYWYNMFVAYHGSWNRSEPTGYKIVRYKLDKDGNYLGEEDLISGWLNEKNESLGRPVDILTLPGGVIYVSDDKAGVIYRIKYNNI